ncbi:nucleotidyltransferase family protein [Sphingomonas sp.]|uniref:nucleotidyltransferase domain-containing protein n=1 Tax=Sphingomonas sp. TaxID=28214 RepID=UPI002E301090|nr:nucleotidyltransferase family protein [Sphingomonas sp.]HEX4694084.1 nucleotidyltransferase family protein [Sphingomonas sp.]
MRFLCLLCSQATPDGSADAAALARRIADWNAFEHLVARHRVAGLVHAGLKRQPQIVVPVTPRQSIAGAAATIARENMAMALETVRLQRLFDEAGVDAIFFKGATLAQQVYGTFAIRHGKDVDFVVSPGDVERCVALLEQDGYALFDLPSPLSPRQWRGLLQFAMEIVMIHRDRHIQIEPHWQLSDNRRLLPLATLARSASKEWTRIGDVAIRTFHPDDSFAYLCMHGARSGWYRLKWLTDIDALLNPAGEDDLVRLYRHSESLGVGPATALALSLYAQLFGRPVPAEILARVSGNWTLRRLRSLSLSNLDRPRSMPGARRTFMLHMLLAAAHGYLLSELWRWSVSVIDVVRVPLPRPLHFLYPALRFPLLIGRRVAALFAKSSADDAPAA